MSRLKCRSKQRAALALYRPKGSSGEAARVIRAGGGASWREEKSSWSLQEGWPRAA